MGSEWDKFRQRFAWFNGKFLNPKKSPESPQTLARDNSYSHATKQIYFEIPYNIIQRTIELELEKKVAQDQDFLRIGGEKIKLFQKEMALKEEKRAKDKKWHDQFSFYLNLYLVVGLLMLGSVGVGVVLGINIPEAIACHSEHSPCWHLRLRNLKTIIKR